MMICPGEITQPVNILAPLSSISTMNVIERRLAGLRLFVLVVLQEFPVETTQCNQGKKKVFGVALQKRKEETGLLRFTYRDG